MTERELQNMVLELCKHMGLLAYHTYDSRRSQPGFPDLVIVGRARLMYRELKTEKGKLSTDQRTWMDALWQTGADVALWRPSDWPDRIVAELRTLGTAA